MLTENTIRETTFDEYTPAPTDINAISGGLVGIVTTVIDDTGVSTDDEVETKYDYYTSATRSDWCRTSLTLMAIR